MEMKRNAVAILMGFCMLASVSIAAPSRATRDAESAQTDERVQRAIATQRAAARMDSQQNNIQQPRQAPVPKGSIEQQLADLRADVEELKERADENELSAALSKVKFSFEFNTSVHNIFQKTSTQKNNDANRWMMGLYLNMNADVNKYTKFTGRLSMTKAFGDMEWLSSASPIGATDAGRGISGGSAVYVERAYVDLYFGRYFALTVGRLPATDGPGSLLRNSSARMSTYPALAVNALGDGAVLTYKPYGDIAIRGGYSKIYQPATLGDFGGGGSVFGSNTKSVADANLFFAMVESPFLPKSMGSSLFMLAYVNLQDYTIAANSIKSIYDTYNGNAVSDTYNGNAVSAGNMHYINAHLEGSHSFNKLMLNWFVSGTYYKGYNGISMPVGTTTLAFANNDAYAVHAGLRFDVASLKLGYEYFKGSKYWYALSRVSINDPFNFRATRGYVHDVYAIWQLDLYQFFRLSYTLQQLDYGMPDLPIITANTDTLNQNVAITYIVRF